jgi:CheY-like chemotaxis protein
MKQQEIELLFVDDEAEFRQVTSRVLSRRGFTVFEAATGQQAVELVHQRRFDVALLDLRMPGMDGISTLLKIRQIIPDLPVIILTGHGDLDSAMAGIRLDIIDFLQKPIEPDLLADRVRSLLEKGVGRPLRERRIEELMVPASQYRRLYVDQPVKDAVESLWQEFFGEPGPAGAAPLRSALVYDRRELFLGVVRFHDLLKLVIPPFLEASPYPAYYTGMFAAQCKLIGTRAISELITDTHTIEVDAPLIEAVHLMVLHHLVNLPVIRKGNLVGILRERDIIREIAAYVTDRGLAAH